MALEPGEHPEAKGRFRELKTNSPARQRAFRSYFAFRPHPCGSAGWQYLNK